MANDILVKIGADAKSFNDAIDGITKKTEDLQDSLEKVAKVSGGLFAAIAGSAGVAIAAYRDSEKAANELNVALANQGKAVQQTGDAYKKYADTVSKATGIDDDALVASQAKIQALIGQADVTEELTAAMAYLSTQTGSLDSAAEILGRAYQGNTRALKVYGITIDENASAQERLDQAIAGVNGKFGGQAAVLTTGTGSIKKLQTSFGNLLEDVGKRLAPAFEKGVIAITNFIEKVRDNEALLDFAVQVGKVIAVFAGGIATLATAGIAFVKLNQAFQIASTGLKLLGLTARGALLASGIGALVVAATLIYENWADIWPRVQAVFVGVVAGISKAARGAGQIITGALTGNLEDIKAGFDALKGSVAEGIKVGGAKFDETKKPTPPDTSGEVAALTAAEEQKLAIKRKYADAAAEEQKRRDELNREQTLNSIEIATLQATQGSEELIKLKQSENEVLKQLEEAKNADLIAALEARLEAIRALEEEAMVTQTEEQAAFNEQVLTSNAEFLQLDADQKAAFLAKNQQALQASILTENEAKQKAALVSLQNQIAANNKFIEEQQKYGTAYATINKVMYSDQVQGAQKGFSELTQLQNSSSKELKAVGKAAAIADITYKTAQSAMNIFTGFSAIPFVGPAMGVAGAAVAIAYGAEQIGKVVAAQDGGIVPGFNMGGDSTPAILQPGELVVPRANFSEVVNAVAAQRASEAPQASALQPAPIGTQAVNVKLEFAGDNAEKFLTARQVEARNLGTYRSAQ